VLDAMRMRVVFRGEETHRAWALAIVLSVLIHAALLAWPRWPSLREIGGGDPGLAARIVASPAVAPSTAPAASEIPETTKSATSATRADVPTPPTRTAPPPASPAPRERPPELERAALPAAAASAAAPTDGSAPRAREANSGGSAANSRSPGMASDIASVAQYRITLMSAARRFVRVPDAVDAQGREGRVDVRLTIAADGSLARTEVLRSSGQAALDALALEMLRNAKADAPVPPALLAREFEVEVPVVFSIPR
jgi:protein TonB